MLIFVYLHVEELDKATKETVNHGYLHVCVSDGDLWGIDIGLDLRNGKKEWNILCIWFYVF